MSTNRKYTVVVAGCGKRGQHHAEAFFNNPRFELVGLCDVDPARAEAVAKKFGNPRVSTQTVSFTPRDPAGRLLLLHPAERATSLDPSGRGSRSEAHRV